MAYNRFRALGGLIYTGENLGDNQLDMFASAGGKWIAPVIYGDESAGPWNRTNFVKMQNKANERGMEVAGWFNVSGGDPAADAKNIRIIVKNYNIPLVLLDAELHYQWPQGNPELLPTLLQAIRRELPGVDLMLSSLGPNNSYIYNGRTLQPVKSMYDLGWRHAPQWYNSYYVRDGNTTPQARMKWMMENAHKDYNIRDSSAPNARGLPLSYIHPTVEATGMEGSDLATELVDVKESQRWGMTAGISYYTLEHLKEADAALLKRYKGVLFD